MSVRKKEDKCQCCNEVYEMMTLQQDHYHTSTQYHVCPHCGYDPTLYEHVARIIRTDTRIEIDPNTGSISSNHNVITDSVMDLVKKQFKKLKEKEE